MAEMGEVLADRNRPSSDVSDERTAEEEDALLAGKPLQPSGIRNWMTWRELAILAWALVATVAVVVIAITYQQRLTKSPGSSGPHSEQPASPGNSTTRPSGKRNLIFMVSDGMGPTSLTLTRSFQQFAKALPPDDILILDQHLIGSSRTRSTSSLVTDSAAGATAFACGKKSYNGAISILPDHTLCGTVLEAAKKAGYMTGLVVTTRITDATPACFAAHVNLRNEEDLIARQMVGDHPLGRVVDLMLGGGRCHFLPKGAPGSCRSDGRDIVQMAKDHGYSYLDDRAGFDALELGKSAKLPLLGLFASTDIPYEIDRRNMEEIYPSLDEMARTALTALSEATRDNDQGFFLMIEGSRIDHAGHANDPAAQVHEVLAYDQAFATALDFVETSDTAAVVVSTSDHETGGLATARQLHPSYPEYLWHPGVLANVSHSAEHLAQRFREYRQNGRSDSEVESFVREVLLRGGLGVLDATDHEIQDLIDRSDSLGVAYILADIVSRRAQSGWSTHGHSGVDVNIYSSSVLQTTALLGNHENTEVGNFLSDYLDLDLAPITHELNSKLASFNAAEDSAGGSWTGHSLAQSHNLDHMDHYQGDFKRSLELCDHH